MHTRLTPHLGSQGVSWIRLSDYKILTNGLITFTTDKRIDMIHSAEGSERTLRLEEDRVMRVMARIHRVVEGDQGGYQCQAATSSGDSHMSTFDLLEATFASRFISQKGLCFSQLSLRRMCAIKK